MTDKEREAILNNCAFLLRRALTALKEVTAERVNDVCVLELQTEVVDLYTSSIGLKELCE